MFHKCFGFLLQAVKQSFLPVSLNNQDTASAHSHMGFAKEAVIGRRDAIEGRTPPHRIRHTPAGTEAGGVFYLAVIPFDCLPMPSVHAGAQCYAYLETPHAHQISVVLRKTELPGTIESQTHREGFLPHSPFSPQDHRNQRRRPAHLNISKTATAKPAPGKRVFAGHRYAESPHRPAWLSPCLKITEFHLIGTSP
jgi:hypothetical protein